MRRLPKALVPCVLDSSKSRCCLFVLGLVCRLESQCYLSGAERSFTPKNHLIVCCSILLCFFIPHHDSSAPSSWLLSFTKYGSDPPKENPSWPTRCQTKHKRRPSAPLLLPPLCTPPNTLSIIIVQLKFFSQALSAGRGTADGTV